MSSSTASPPALDPTVAARSAGAQLRLLALAALLVGEAVLAREAIDTDALIGHGSWWVEPIRALAHNVPWGACVLATVGLLGAGHWRAAFAQVGERAPLAHSIAVAVLAHVLWLWVFVRVSQLVFAGGSTIAAIDALLPVAWIGSALAAAICAGLAVAPATAWRRAFAPLRGALVGGAVLGSSLFWIGSWIDGNYFLWGPLADVTLRASAWFTGLFTDSVYLEESTRILGTDRFRVIVTKYCSGLEGLALFGLFFGAFTVVARERLRVARALWLLPIGMLLVWTFNAARIAALIALGHFHDPQLAVDAFHTHAGWPPLIAVALGCVAVAIRVPYFARTATHGAGVANGTPAAVDARDARTGAHQFDRATSAYLLPLLAVVGTALVAGAFLDEGSASAPLRVAVGGLVLWTVRRDLPRPANLAAWFDGARQWHVWLAAIVCGALWIALDPGAGAAGTRPSWASQPGFAVFMWPLAFASYAAITPLVEELAFRGYLQRKLVRGRFEEVSYRAPAPAAVAGSALAFGLVHSSVAGGVAAGVLFSLAAARRGRLGDAVWAHVLVNAGLAGLAVARGEWGWWF